MIERMTKESIKGMKAYLVDNSKYDIKIDANESNTNIFQEIMPEIWGNVMKEDINRYPDSEASELRKAISGFIGVPPEKILCGNGSDELIKMIVDGFVNPGEVVLSHSPTFGMYGVSTRVSGGTYAEIETDEVFNIDIDALIAKARELKPKLIFLCNPNNPTGNILEKSQVRRVLRETESILVLDEAYIEFAGESMVDEIGDWENLVIMRTLSKAFGLAGLRLGYIIADGPIMEVMRAIKPPYNLNRISQRLATEVLVHASYINKNIEAMKDERERMLGELAKIDELKVFPTKSNFILLRTAEAEKLDKAFKDESILVRKYSGGRLENCLRISIGSQSENEAVMAVIRGVFK
ncbi:MAG: histidinol-phosphate transaminase [Peptostreptococcaceae bacterium]|nr:histidinol-phosphate transaminase [Peptostreptococcaceae bacterium]